MEKKLNRKKVLIVSIILITIIGIIAFFVIRHIRGDVAYIAPGIEEPRPEEDGMVKYENNISKINILDRKVEKIDGKQYIVIEIQNNTEEDIFDLPVGIEFINSDGDVIYNTGHVVEVLLKGMKDHVYALATPQIAKLVEKDKIDHIVIKELE